MARTTAGTRLVAGTRTTAGTRTVVRNFGTCLSFSNNSVLVKSGRILSNLTNASLSLWINPSNSNIGSSGAAFYSERASSGSDIWKIGFAGTPNDYKVRFTHRDDSNTLTQTLTTSTYADNKWHLLVLSKTGTNLKIFWDAVQIENTTLNGNDTLTNSNTECRIGSDVADGNTRYYGFIDDLILYPNVSLSITDAQNIYYTGATPSGASNRWKMDEGSGTSLADSIGADTGTITGATYSTNVFMVARSAA